MRVTICPRNLVHFHLVLVYTKIRQVSAINLMIFTAFFIRFSKKNVNSTKQRNFSLIWKLMMNFVNQIINIVSNNECTRSFCWVAGFSWAQFMNDIQKERKSKPKIPWPESFKSPHWYPPFLEGRTLRRRIWMVYWNSCSELNTTGRVTVQARTN